jgi:hypothetical protein
VPKRGYCYRQHVFFPPYHRNCTTATHNINCTSSIHSLKFLLLKTGNVNLIFHADESSNFSTHYKSDELEQFTFLESYSKPFNVMNDDTATLHFESAVVLLYFPDRNTQCCSGTIFLIIRLCRLFYYIAGACGDMTEEVS